MDTSDTGDTVRMPYAHHGQAWKYDSMTFILHGVVMPYNKHSVARARSKYHRQHVQRRYDITTKKSRHHNRGRQPLIPLYTTLYSYCIYILYSTARSIPRTAYLQVLPLLLASGAISCSHYPRDVRPLHVHFLVALELQL